jgi:hypothetical protein
MTGLSIDENVKQRRCPLWVKSGVTLLNFDVRFTPESGHSSARSRCPLWAKSRHDQLTPIGHANRRLIEHQGLH